MKYYLVSNSCDEKVIGPEYHQTEGHPLGVIPEFSNTEFIEHDMPLPYTLEKKAILTDVVSASNTNIKGFLINEKVKNIFNQFNLYKHKYYDANLEVKGQVFKYYYLNLLTCPLEMVDFEKSEFMITDIGYDKLLDIQIKNLNEYIEERNKLKFQFLATKKMILLETIQKNPMDIFLFQTLHSGILISSKLKEKLIESNITGFHFANQMFY